VNNNPVPVKEKHKQRINVLIFLRYSDLRISSQRAKNDC